MSVYFVKFLLQLKNASIAKKEKLSVEYSDLREKMTTILYTEGFVQSFEIIFDLSNNFKTILITLRYYFSRSLLESLKLLSKPSHVRYMKFSDVSNIPDRRFVLFFFY
jgi:ribosomal protein S8